MDLISHDTIPYDPIIIMYNIYTMVYGIDKWASYGLWDLVKNIYLELEIYTVSMGATAQRI